MEEMVSSVNHLTETFRTGVNVNVSELGGSDGENYLLGLVQMQEHCAKAQYEMASVRAQANTIALIGQLGLSFDSSGGLSERDEDRLHAALRLVKSSSEILCSDMRL
jgi:hypothetical protein